MSALDSQYTGRFCRYEVGARAVSTGSQSARARGFRRAPRWAAIVRPVR